MLMRGELKQPQVCPVCGKPNLRNSGSIYCSGTCKILADRAREKKRKEILKKLEKV